MITSGTSQTAQIVAECLAQDSPPSRHASVCLTARLELQVGPCHHPARGRVWAASQLPEERRVRGHAPGACCPCPGVGCNNLLRPLAKSLQQRLREYVSA